MGTGSESISIFFLESDESANRGVYLFLMHSGESNFLCFDLELGPHFKHGELIVLCLVRFILRMTEGFEYSKLEKVKKIPKRRDQEL